jgi:hypothetical protein
MSPYLLNGHTLFNEWTKMFFAPISLKSLSASYFKSFETLNLSLKGKKQKKKS